MADEKQFTTLETAGIYKGTLMEDVAKTMERTKGRFAKIFCPDIWSDKEGSYPYTYIDGIDELPDLLEGDEVWISFAQGNFLYPRFHKIAKELPENIYKVKSLNDKVDDKDERLESAEVLGEKGLVQVTDKKYTIAFADTFICMKENKLYISCNGSTFVMDGDGITIESKGNKIVMNNNGVDINNGNLTVSK